MRAQLDENNMVFHVTGAEIPLSDKVIEVDDYSVLGKKYNAETGEFMEPEPIPEPEPTQLDEIQRTQIDIMEAMACQYEENLENQLMQMDVLATIYETQLELGGVE